MGFQEKLIFAVIITLISSGVSLYLIAYNKQYMIAYISIFIASLFAFIMVFFTLYNYVVNTNQTSKQPIKLNTCPDYYFTDYITNSNSGKVEKICKPFIFEGSDKENLYMLKTINPLANTITTLEEDKNFYNGGNKQGFYNIEDVIKSIDGTNITYLDGSINGATIVGTTPAVGHQTKFCKILDWTDPKPDLSINLTSLNDISVNSYNKEEMNRAMCSCGTNLGWTELQEKCGKENLLRGDKADACTLISSYIHNTTPVVTSANIDPSELNGLNLQSYSSGSQQDFVNRLFIDPQAIQADFTQ